MHIDGWCRNPGPRWPAIHDVRQKGQGPDYASGRLLVKYIIPPIAMGPSAVAPDSTPGFAASGDSRYDQHPIPDSSAAKLTFGTRRARHVQAELVSSNRQHARAHGHKLI
jgi:hypothetical protein